MTSDNSKPAADEQLLSLDELRDLWNAQADAVNSWDALGADEIVWWAQRQALARAGLADGPAVPEGREPASVVSEPSDEELLALVPQGSESDFYLPQGLPSNWVDGDFIAPPEAVVAFARAVLARFGHPALVPAEGEVAGPTDEEIIAFWSEHCAGDGDAGIIRLARWGNQPVPPAEGGAGELASLIREAVRAWVAWEEGAVMLNNMTEVQLTRVADLLSQRHPAPVPVAVPEGREPASVTGEPSDEELLATLDKATATFPPRHPEAEALNAVEYPLALELRKARAVLARFGHHSPDATKMVGHAEGDVAELVAWLRMQGEAQKPGPNSLLSDRTKKERHAAGVKLTRAADLLEQCHPAPVPVAERLPGPEDCDAELYCWRWNTIGGLWARQPLARSWYEFESHWLPATALPLPQGEVK